MEKLLSECEEITKIVGKSLGTLRLNQGKQAEVMAFGETTSAKLKEAADDFIDLSAEKGKFLINDKRYLKR